MEIHGLPFILYHNFENMNEDILLSPEEVAREQQRFMVKVYSWMAGALAITGIVAMWAASSISVITFIYQNTWVFIGLMIAKLLMVGSLAGWVHKMSATTASESCAFFLPSMGQYALRWGKLSR